MGRRRVGVARRHDLVEGFALADHAQVACAPALRSPSCPSSGPALRPRACGCARAGVRSDPPARRSPFAAARLRARCRRRTTGGTAAAPAGSAARRRGTSWVSARYPGQRHGESLGARVARVGAQLGFDAQQLVVLGDAVRARHRAGLDLRRAWSPPRCRRWSRPRSRPSGARRPTRSPPSSAMSMAASVSVSVPIWFTLMRIALAIFLSMPSFRIFVLVTNRSSPTSCTLLAEPLRQHRPAVPVALAHAVLDGDDRIARRPGLRDSRRTARRVNLRCFGLELVDAVLVELGARDVQAEVDLPAGLVAGLVDRLEDRLQRRLVRRQVRREAALVADGGGELALVQDFLERVEDLRAVAQRFAKATARRPAGS